MDMTGPEPELKQGKKSTNTAPVTYLENFEQLGEQIFYDKPTPSSRPGRGQPDLIILCSWLYALPKHIAKYTEPYRRLFPAAPILLLKQDGPDLIWRPNSRQLESMKPAIDIIEATQKAKGNHAKILVQVWSNGGSFTLTQLADFYAAVNKGSKLPISALIIDSAPSAPDLKRGYVALSEGMPKNLPAPFRYIGGAMIYSVLTAGAVVGKLLGSEGAISGMRRKLNDPEGPFIGGLRRIYLYSESDNLVPWQHVEEHAEDARRKSDAKVPGSGKNMVKLEKFSGSKHVAHAVVDPERYWDIVQTFWREVIETS